MGKPRSLAHHAYTDAEDNQVMCLIITIYLYIADEVISSSLFFSRERCRSIIGSSTNKRYVVKVFFSISSH